MYIHNIYIYIYIHIYIYTYVTILKGVLSQLVGAWIYNHGYLLNCISHFLNHPVLQPTWRPDVPEPQAPKGHDFGIPNIIRDGRYWRLVHMVASYINIHIRECITYIYVYIISIYIYIHNRCRYIIHSRISDLLSGSFRSISSFLLNRVWSLLSWQPTLTAAGER